MDNSQQTTSFSEQFFRFSLANKDRIIEFFKIFYFIFVLIILYSTYSIYTKNPFYGNVLLNQFALYCGKAAIVLLAVVLTPGICRRFRLRNRLIDLVMLFRRYLGISVFFLGFTHGFILYLFPQLLNGNLKINFSFTSWGIAAVFLMSFMFVTSNDFSVKKLGRWWKRIHRVVYVIVWLIVVHTGLQRLSIWSIIITVVATAEVTSLIYASLTQPPNTSQK